MGKAELLLRERVVLREDAFADIRVWRVPQPVRGSAHLLKYALALVVKGTCILRYDNEAGKGDHRHTANRRELSYPYRDADGLIADFWTEVDQWLAENPS